MQPGTVVCMTTGIGILVVDDHQGYVDALALYVADEQDLWLAGVATTAGEALDRLPRVRVDVVVAADELPPGGLELAAAMLRVRPELPILLLSDTGVDADLLDAVEIGVRGWVCRGDGLDALLTAVRAVARGESHLPLDRVRALLASRVEPSPDQRVEQMRRLTERESAVLAALAAGMSRADICESLQLSPNTVRTHVRSILRKCHVHSAPDAVALVTGQVRHG